MKCKMMSFMVPEGPPYFATGAAKCITRCETHNWTFDNYSIANELCPLGRIENAVEEGIQKLLAVGK